MMGWLPIDCVGNLWLMQSDLVVMCPDGNADAPEGFLDIIYFLFVDYLGPLGGSAVTMIIG